MMKHLVILAMCVFLSGCIGLHGPVYTIPCLSVPVPVTRAISVPCVTVNRYHNKRSIRREKMACRQHFDRSMRIRR